MSADTWIARWSAAVAADPENAHIGRFSYFAVRVQEDTGAERIVRYTRGTVSWGTADGDAASVPEAPAVITLRGSRSAWRELVDPHARPRRHDLLALTKVPDGIEIVSGRDDLIRNLRVLTRLVELGRACA